MSSTAKRSIHAVDVRHRIWDVVNSCWVATGSQRKEFFIQKSSAEKAIEALVAKGRNPTTLVVKKVVVQLAPGEG